MANTNTEIIAMLETNPSQAIRGVLDTLYLYNPATVNDLIEKLNEVIVQGGFEAIVVDTLPETGVKGTIYFVPSGGETPNVYNEYVWVTETEKFEMVGSAQVDLSNYYTKDEIDEQLIEIVGYVGDQTRPIRNDLNQLNQNTLKVANWVNAKDEEGNRAVLETEAQDAYRAINELNAKIGAGGDYLPLSGGTLTGELGLKHPDKAYETKIYMAENGVLHFQSAFEVRFYNSLFPNSSTAYNAPTLGLYSSPWKEGYISKLHTKKLYNGADIAVPTEGGTLARLEDLNDITTVTIKEYD